MEKFYQYFENNTENVEFISMKSNSTDGSSNLIIINKL